MAERARGVTGCAGGPGNEHGPVRFVRTGLRLKDTSVKDALWFSVETLVPMGEVEFMGFDVPGVFFFSISFLSKRTRKSV